MCVSVVVQGFLVVDLQFIPFLFIFHFNSSTERQVESHSPSSFIFLFHQLSILIHTMTWGSCFWDERAAGCSSWSSLSLLIHVIQWWLPFSGLWKTRVVNFIQEPALKESKSNITIEINWNFQLTWSRHVSVLVLPDWLDLFHLNKRQMQTHREIQSASVQLKWT